MAIEIDATEFLAGMKRMEAKAADGLQKAIDNVAEEILRLSQREVPHDSGALQNTGHTKKLGKLHSIVGYNKVYAARLHENPQYRFQKGRKGKYLEDPIKSNTKVFRNYFEKFI